MAAHQQSALGMALNGKSAHMDIPKHRDGGLTIGRDNLTAVTTDGRRAGMLPTPPNSISPNLAPHRRLGPDASTSPTISAQQESDLELHDAPGALNAEALDRLGDLESAGAITSAMLSKHYLPDILLANGPLAIRHIMGYLTTTVPGFSRITSAKARRLVVAALEGRGSGGEGAGLDGDVVFDKIGWGKWDARRKGQPPRDYSSHDITPPGSLPSSYSHGAMQMPDRRSWGRSDNLGTSLATSGGFSHSDFRDVGEHHADQMSMDGDDDGYQSSEAPEPLDVDMEDDDETDEEDWQSIGAEALKARSLPASSLPGPGRLYQPISYSVAPRFRSKTPANVAQSVPVHAIPVQKPGHVFASGVHDSSERAAVEALLNLRSM